MSTRKALSSKLDRHNRKNLKRHLILELLEHRIVFAGVSPVAVNDVYSAVADTQLQSEVAGVLANDTDAEGDVLTAVQYKGPSHGTLALNPDGSFAYTPNPGFTGIDSFLYQADDGTARSKLAAVTIQVSAPNVAPQAEDDTYSMGEDTLLDIGSSHGLLTNDSDPDGNQLNTAVVSGPEHGVLSLDSDGSFVYQPDENFNGVDSFVYANSDGASSDESTVAITIASVNDDPVAANDSYATDEDVPLVVDVQGVVGNDTDVDDGAVLTAVLSSEPDHGSLTLNDDGSFTYVPDKDFHGTDAFTYQAFDGSTFSDVVVVEITISAVNDAPVAANDAYTTDEDVALVIDGLGALGNDTDVDADTILTAVLTDGPVHGTLTLNEDGSFSYSPDQNYHGTDAFTYRAFDGTDFSEVVVVELTITSVDDSPVGENDQYSATEDSDLIIEGSGVLENDADLDTDTPLTAVLSDGPDHGTLTLNEDGSFTYSPEENFIGSDAFTYRAFDGTNLSEIVVVEILVSAVNDSPIATNDSYAVDEDTDLIVDGPGVLSNDSDVELETFLTAVLSNAPEHGSLTLNDDGSFTYSPDANFNGTDTFSYRAFDGTDLSEEVIVEIAVSAVNDAPVVADDSYSTDENVALIVDLPGVLENDSDVDAGTVLTSVVAEGPTHGTLTLGEDGGFVYTPDVDFVGTDSFTYMAGDGELSIAGVVSIVVQAANDKPISLNESYTVSSGSTLEVESLQGVAVNDSDTDGDALEAILYRGPKNGVLVLGLDGSFKYTPKEGFVGVDAFIYRVTDSNLSSSLAVATIHVVPPIPALETAQLQTPITSETEAIDAALADITGSSSSKKLMNNNLDTEFALCDWGSMIGSTV